jgi:uncharacterized protein YkwD
MFIFVINGPSSSENSGMGDVQTEVESPEETKSPQPDLNEPPQIVSPVGSTQESAESISKRNDIQELRQFALSTINADREKSGLEPVALSDNQAAQAHAEDLHRMASGSTHWTSDGMKPYMRYTIYNGTGFVSQNVHAYPTYHPSTILQCKVGLAICEKVNIRQNTRGI